MCIKEENNDYLIRQWAYFLHLKAGGGSRRERLEK
jgi:hypothetical protein